MLKKYKKLVISEESAKEADMYQRINILLPEKTVLLIDQFADRKNRSQFIDEAVKYYTEQVGKISLREQLKQGAIRRAERDLNLSNEWNDLEEEAWQTG